MRKLIGLAVVFAVSTIAHAAARVPLKFTERSPLSSAEEMSARCRVWQVFRSQAP